ncbi:MAG: NADH-quinone oxidoreductase subunit N [Rhodothermales bacterium]
MELSNVYDAFLGDMGKTASLVLVTCAGLLLVVWDAFRNNARELPWIAGGVLALAMLIELFRLDVESGTAFYGMVRTGGYASFVNIILLLGGLLTVVLSIPYLEKIRHAYGEVYALILFATAGMITLGTANNLVSIFVGLETMSICLYIMTGLIREDVGSMESALKYFLLGAFATGFFLYGIALLYGATGTMYLPEMAAGLAASGSTLLFWAGVALLMIGFFFKVSAAPFHMWTPDVYQGAPTTLTGFMSTTSKTAAFSALILVLYLALPVERWTLVFAVVAVITMLVGNVVALAQANVKRMLAYSSIAHAGYVLVGLAAGTTEAYAGALYYLLVYTLMNVGAFGVMALLEWDGKAGREQTLDSLAGVGLRRPVLGITMGFFMFSLTGFPPLGGFLGKYAIFAPAIDAGLTWLVIIAVLASAISAYYYLRVLYVFFMLSPQDDATAAEVAARPLSVPASSAAVLVVCAAALLLLGIFPGLLDVTLALFAVAPAEMALVP